MKSDRRKPMLGDRHAMMHFLVLIDRQRHAAMGQSLDKIREFSPRPLKLRG